MISLLTMDYRRIATNLAGLLLLCPLLAWADFDFQHLKSLHEAGNSQEVYRYASEYKDNYEGDPHFDYYYGIAAIDNGYTSDGVFALERTLSAQPSNHSARLELARGYFILEEYARARNEFEKVINTKPPTSVRVKIERYLQAISRKEGRYKTSTLSYTSLGFGYDDNINAAPDDGDFELAPGVILTVGSSEQDMYSSIQAGGKVNVPTAPGRAMFGSADFDSKLHASENDYDNYNLSLRGGMNFSKNLNRYRADLQYQNYNFDGENLRNIFAINGEWSYQYSHQGQFSLFGQVADLDYPDADIRNSKLFTFGAGFSRQLTSGGSPVWFASVYTGNEEPDENSDDAARIAERDFLGARVGAQFSISGHSRLRGSVGFQSSRYGEDDIIEGDEREDDYYSLTGEHFWQFNKRWSLRTRLNYADNDSNSRIYDFGRTFTDVRLHIELD